MRSFPAALALMALAVGVATAGVRVSPTAAQEGGPSDISWQSAGDSYSSGEGVFGNEGACAQSSDAFGPTASERLRADGWNITGEAFTACTGHLVEDYFNARSREGDSLSAWGREQGGPDRTDVITMSFGGNDIGFADIISDCLLGKPDSWGEYLVGGVASSATGCDESKDELNARADRLLDPTSACTGRRHTGAARALSVPVDGFECDLALNGRRGSIIDFYFDVVQDRLTDRGRLYVVGYPRLFADVDQWPLWSKLACQGVKRGDTEKLGRAAEHLNNKLQEAVRRANEALGAERVVFVDRFAPFPRRPARAVRPWRRLAQRRGSRPGRRVRSSAPVELPPERRRALGDG